VSSVASFVEQGVLAMQNCFLQRAFANIVTQARLGSQLAATRTPSGSTVAR
jgi:hypothetical protein